eukprot:GFYU01054806.1.p1 GENE.GFYU01054806.1~~GFYU01054806.1.p1  ORF type:complete len:429 (+),score=165.12 GFYU01054806.1:78-1364(+)
MDAYDAMEVIGKGSFGVVRKIRRKSDGKILVWKEMNYGQMNEKEKQLLVSEVNILRELRHPHVVRYYDRMIDRSSTTIYIVMEHCEGGDLAGLIKKAKRERRQIDEDTVWKIFAQCLLALNECHNYTYHNPDGEGQGKNSRIVHRDLKPSNVFLDSNNNIKIGDFGLARILGNGSLARTNVGTPFYMSPEQVKELPYNEKTDIWSLGCLIYEMCALVPPFEAHNTLALATKIKIGRFPRLSSSYSEELNKATRIMLQVDTHRRPSVDELMSLPQVQLRLRERKITQQYNMIKKREEEVSRKESELKRREEALDSRERDIDRRERDLARMESAAKRPPLRNVGNHAPDYETTEPPKKSEEAKPDSLEARIQAFKQLHKEKEDKTADKMAELRKYTLQRARSMDYLANKNNGIPSSVADKENIGAQNAVM